MSYYHSHILSVKKIIETVIIGEPLAFQLKRFFAADKKYGSKDRKQIASLCYNYYRLGNAVKNKPIEDKIIIAVFLCNQKNNSFLQELYPNLNDQIHISIEEKLQLLKINDKDIFDWENEISEQLNKHKFIHSFFTQPLLYIRLRPNKSDISQKKLSESSLPFTLINDSCISLQQSISIVNILQINNEVIIQDYNSQKVFNYIKEKTFVSKKIYSVWDCCAASGGKSILLYDILKGNVQLEVSDIRPHILNNLRSRFKEAGIKNYKTSLKDISNDDDKNDDKKFDIIICDVPCTGSGTWSRTPEQAYYFDINKINEFANTQKQIASNAIKHLQKDALFFYITCSAFEKENESVVKYISETFQLKILEMKYLKGYEMQADTMFVAVLSL